MLPRTRLAVISAAAAITIAAVFAGSASAGTQLIGPYTVTDTVTWDFVNNTTTATYDVTVPNTPGFDSLSHINLVVHTCQPPHNVTNISDNGTVEANDPSSGQPGPLIKWDDGQASPGTETYSYTVSGIYGAANTTFGIKQSGSYFTGTVQGIGCEPPDEEIPPGTIVIDKVTDPAGETQEFGFSAPSLPGTADDSFNLIDGSTPKSVSVEPGTYQVTENANPAGWTLTGIACDDGQSTGPSTVSLGDRLANVNVQAGETVMCTFTNTKNPPEPLQQQQQQDPPPQQIQEDPPPEQQVLGEQVRPGSARLAGRTGCQARAFNVRVGGREIERVVFSIDGRRVRTVRRPNSDGKYVLRVNPRRYKAGPHRVRARVTFSAASQTPPRTLRLRFERCISRPAPQFTG